LIDKLAEPYDIEKTEEFCHKYIEADTGNCTGRICEFIYSLQNR